MATIAPSMEIHSIITEFLKQQRKMLIGGEWVEGASSAVWTRDVSTADKVAAKLRAGTVWVNCYKCSTPRFRLVATGNPAGAANRVIRRLNCTRKPRRSARNCSACTRGN